MSKQCQDSCVGHVMACTLASHADSFSMDEMMNIASQLEKERQKTEKVAEQVINNFKNKLASGGITREELSESEAQSDIPTDPAEKQSALDQTVMCSVACCCHKNPSQGKADQDLYQACMHGVFATADAALNYKSRYKSEISYDMKTNSTPIPLMHRDPNNPYTTEPSRNWMRRAKTIIGYRPRSGHIRRPDLVIVKDPSLPPEADNIERVIEYKFGSDPRNLNQNKAYRKIAGKRKKYSIFRIGKKPQGSEKTCNCKNPAQIV